MTVMKTSASLIIGTCLLSLLSGCGKSDSSGGGVSGRQRPNPVAQELPLAGQYQANLTSLNSSVSGFATGKAKISVVGDSISVEVALKDSPAMTTHAQFIYTSNECPGEIHDTNRDGFIDPIEAEKVLGPILIPLDGDLNSQLEGVEYFPVADALGSYVYFKEGVLSKMLSDLSEQDPDPKDELSKLAPGEKLKLEGKVIVIQGVPDSVYLPGSVRTFIGLSERATLSIACGKIVRMLNQETTTSEPGSL